MKDGVKMNFILLAALHPASYSLSKDDNSRLPIKTYAFCLDPTDERVVEFQRAIYEEMERLMIGDSSVHLNRKSNELRNHQSSVMAAAERVHGESNVIRGSKNLLAS